MGQIYRWIAPDGKSKKKGGKRIQVRVIEYAIESDGQQQVYRLVTDLLDKRDVSSFIVSRGISPTRS